MADQEELQVEQEDILNEAEETETEIQDEEQEEEAEQPETDAEDADDEGELTIEIEGFEPEPEDDNEVIKSLRGKIKELTSTVKNLQKTAPPKKLRAEPTLEDHDYDSEAYKADLLKWADEKRDFEADEKKQQAEIERQRADYEEKLTAYTVRKSQLGVKDFDEAEEVVRDALPPELQSVIVSTSKDSAVTVLALGRNPKILADMANLDPVTFAYKLAILESKMSQPTRTKPAPEKRVVAGKVAVPASADKQLAKLREEAEKTGDYSKVVAFKAQQRAT